VLAGEKVRKAIHFPSGDLTLLVARNNGRFPSSKVKHILIDSPVHSANTSAEMPQWGPAFRALDRNYPSMTWLRVNNLVSYLDTLQAQNPYPTR
jgi:hypothetical protein